MWSNHGLCGCENAATTSPPPPQGYKPKTIDTAISTQLRPESAQHHCQPPSITKSCYLNKQVKKGSLTASSRARQQLGDTPPNSSLEMGKNCSLEVGGSTREKHVFRKAFHVELDIPKGTVSLVHRSTSHARQTTSAGIWCYIPAPFVSTPLMPLLSCLTNNAHTARTKGPKGWSITWLAGHSMSAVGQPVPLRGGGLVFQAKGHTSTAVLVQAYNCVCCVCTATGSAGSTHTASTFQAQEHKHKHGKTNTQRLPPQLPTAGLTG